MLEATSKVCLNCYTDILKPKDEVHIDIIDETGYLCDDCYDKLKMYTKKVK